MVHVDHGIARFGGLQTLDLGERSGEFMLLYYAEDAKLYVPVERLDLVQRYSSGEGASADARSSWRNRMAEDQGESQARHARHG